MESPNNNIHLADMLVSHLTSPNFIKDEASLLEQCAGAGFYPETDRFAVLLVEIERWSDLFSTEAQWLEATKHHFFLLHNMLHELLGEGCRSIEGEKDYQMVCLINLLEDWPSFRVRLRSMMDEMMEVLETEFGVSVTITVSAEVRGLTKLPEAYLEARETLWYNTFLGLDAQVTFFEDANNDPDRMPMIRSDLTVLDKKLISRLQMNDPEGVRYVLHEMIDREFIQSRPTVQILRTRLGGICCRILDAMEEFRSILGDEYYYQLNPAPRIVEAATLTEMTGSMDELFEAIAETQNRAAQEPKPQWVDRMSDYIEEHYMDETLGLTEVSAVFGITPSYATRVFKQYSGRGIYETIQHVRLAAAKQLMHTDMTMKQIAQAVGYTSFLSMNRAFKKYEGTTPTRFRDQ